MRARHVVVVGAALVALAGCGGGDKPEAAPAATKAPTIDSGVVPEPDAAAAKAYIADLRKIDADIVGDDTEKVIDRGRNQCSSVKDSPKDQAKLVDSTNQRFTSPEHPDGFGEKKATKILAAVRKHLCPNY